MAWVAVQVRDCVSKLLASVLGDAPGGERVTLPARNKAEALLWCRPLPLLTITVSVRLAGEAVGVAVRVEIQGVTRPAVVAR